MTREDVDKVGRGRVWTGRQAREIKLVDELGGLSKAIELAKDLAGIGQGRGAEARGLAEEEGVLELDLRPQGRRVIARADFADIERPSGRSGSREDPGLGDLPDLGVPGADSGGEAQAVLRSLMTMTFSSGFMSQSFSRASSSTALGFTVELADLGLELALPLFERLEFGFQGPEGPPGPDDVHIALFPEEGRHEHHEDEESHAGD